MTTPRARNGTSAPSRKEAARASPSPSHQASSTIEAILTNSDGWSERPGSRIQRAEPFTVRPRPGTCTTTSETATTASSATAVPRRNQNRGRTHATSAHPASATASNAACERRKCVGSWWITRPGTSATLAIITSPRLMSTNVPKRRNALAQRIAR